MPGQEVPRPAKPREKHQRGQCVKPREVPSAPHSRASAVMPAGKGNVQLEGQMNVHGAGEKRHRHQSESYKEAEQIEVRPGHKTPRNAAPRRTDWNSRRDPYGSVVQ